MVRVGLIFLLMLYMDVDGVEALDIEGLKSGVVRITATQEGNKSKVGTGFIVKLDSETAYILTAAHVVHGDPQPKVQFFPRQDVQVRALVRHAEGGDEETGMVLLTVRGKEYIPTGVAALPWATAARISGGEDIVVIGHPVGAGDWAVLRGSIARRQGRFMTIDANIDERNSGGPIIYSGEVVGLIGGTHRYGKGVSVREYLDGHGVVIQAPVMKEAATVAPMTPVPLPSQEEKASWTPVLKEFFVVSETGFYQQPNQAGIRLGTIEEGFKVYAESVMNGGGWLQVKFREKNGYIPLAAATEDPPWEVLPWLEGDVRARDGKDFDGDDKETVQLEAMQYAAEYVREGEKIRWRSSPGFFTPGMDGYFKIWSTEKRGNQYCRKLYERVHGPGGGSVSHWACRNSQGKWEWR